MNLVVLGGVLAVPFSRNPLYAGLNSRSRVLFRASADHPTGRRATGGHEPRQIRKEAAISDAVCVVDRSRSRYDLSIPESSTQGAQPGIAPFPGPLSPKKNAPGFNGCFPHTYPLTLTQPVLFFQINFDVFKIFVFICLNFPALFPAGRQTKT